MVRGDSVASKSFDCTLAENRTASADSWEFPWESVEEEVLEETFRVSLGKRGTFPADDTLPEVGTLLEVEEEETVADEPEEQTEDFLEASDSFLPKDFASSRK